MGPEEVVERGLLHDSTAEAAAAQDSEVPGEAVDEQALAEAEAAPPQDGAEGEAAAEEQPADATAADDRG